MVDKLYDVVIIGSGPAGVAAAIYCKRFALSTLLVGEAYGGAIARTHLIENYPGFVSGSGYDLMEDWRKNLEKLDIELVDDYVGEISRDEDGKFSLKMDFEGDVKAYSIIYCAGTEERKLGVPGEEKLHGRGVSYCATCDGAFFKGKIIGVVGGSDSAAKEALFLSNFGKKVYIIYRREKIRAEPINIERVENCDEIEIINNTNVVEIYGENKVEGVVLDNGERFPLDGLFIEIGAIPQSDLSKTVGVKTDENGYIIVDEQMQTNVPGFFAAGDVVNRREKQVVVAAGHGAVAAFSAREYVDENCAYSCNIPQER